MRASLFMLMHTDWIGEDGESGVANERRCMADKENRFSLRVLWEPFSGNLILLQPS